MEPGGDALVSAVVGAVERTSTPQDALRGGIHAFFEFVDADRSSWRGLFDETLPTEGGVARRVGEYRTRIADLVSEALLAQPSVSSRTQVEALSIALLGAADALVAAHGIADGGRDGRAADPDRRAGAGAGRAVMNARRVAIVGGNRIPFA